MNNVWDERIGHLRRSWLGDLPEMDAVAQAVADNPASAENPLSEFAARHAVDIAEREVAALTATGPSNHWETVLKTANGASEQWMEQYGLPICQEERRMAQFLYRYPPQRIKEIGNHIVEAFLHGFISQSRDRRNRRMVRVNYCVGQEALAQAVVAALADRGLQAVIQQPQCLRFSGSYAMAHSADKAACLSAEAYDALKAAYESAFQNYASELLDTCGMIGIGQFGEAAAIPDAQEQEYLPEEQRRKRLLQLENAKREMEARYLAPSDLSFCKVAFPNPLVGAEFEEIFDAFYRLNTMDSERYERIQQVLIDALDCCRAVEMIGAPGNSTRLTVALAPLKQPETQTNFLNCGGDLNIPHGELFTTPKLYGTNGVLHVHEIYLKGVPFRDLVLEFQNGMITDYGCGNCGSTEAGRAYVKEHLLQGRETLPMGEFAIGTNTLAYAIVRDRNLMDRMPILLAEKMGPHIAVGDPCFARGEDAPVYNMYDHKEMTARENERTAKRREEHDVYTNIHTDITLAFDELECLEGIRADGSRIPILQKGRFVLPETEALNEPLTRR